MNFSKLFAIIAILSLLIITSLLLVNGMKWPHLSTTPPLHTLSSEGATVGAQDKTTIKSSKNDLPEADMLNKPNTLSVTTAAIVILSLTYYISLIISANIDFSNTLLVVMPSNSLSTYYEIILAAVESYYNYLIIILNILLLLTINPYIYKEMTILLILSTLGLLLMGSSENFISFYLSLELVSLCSYILVSKSTTQPYGPQVNGSRTTDEYESNNEQVYAIFSNNSVIAGIKYFLLSALSSGLLLLGITILYYCTGELDFNSLARIFQNYSYSANSTTAVMSAEYAKEIYSAEIAMCLIIFFVLFKLGAAPFHYWIADVYEKTTIFINYYLIVVVKIGYLFALIKLTFGLALPLVQGLLLVVSLLSLVIGSIGGLVQTKLRRLIAYSSITHVGYILLAYYCSYTNDIVDNSISTFTLFSTNSYMFYITVYSFTYISFFSLLFILIENGKKQLVNPVEQNGNTQPTVGYNPVQVFANPNSTPTTVSEGHVHSRVSNYSEYNTNTDLATMSLFVLLKNPFISASLSVCILSLAGVPPLLGFMSKIAIFKVVLDSGNWVLAILAVLCSVIAAIYYLRILALIYFFNDSTTNYGIFTKKSTNVVAPSYSNNSAPNFLNALIISVITVLSVVYPILNPECISLYLWWDAAMLIN